MADKECTCRTTRRERFLNRQCPLHGDAEITMDEQEFRELFSALDDRDKNAILALIIEIAESNEPEGRRHA